MKVIGESDSIVVASGIDFNHDFIIATDQENKRVLVYDHEGDLQDVIKEKVQYPTDVLIQKDKLFIADFYGKSIVIYELKH